MDFEMFLKKSPHFLWVQIGHDDNIQDCNATFKKFFQIRDCHGDRNAATYFKDWSELKKHDKTWQHTYIEKNWSSGEFIFYLQSNEEGIEVFGELPEHDNQNILNEMSKINNDFMSLTREIEKKNKDLENLLDRLQKTQAQLILKERLAGLGQIAAGIAHEINNPLGIVMANMTYLKKSFETIWNKLDENDFLQDDDDIDWIREDSSDVLEEIQLANLRIKEIVESFREYSDLDRYAEIYPYNLNQGIQQTLNVMNTQFEDVNIELNLNSVGHLMVRGVEINQTLTHLLQNSILALEHNLKEKSIIEISTYESDKGIHMDIKDNGCGMASNVITHAFDPFFSTRDIGEGKGLGLTVCYEVIVNEYGGEISLESQVDLGTVVHIILPKSEEDDYVE